MITVIPAAKEYICKTRTMACPINHLYSLLDSLIFSLSCSVTSPLSEALIVTGPTANIYNVVIKIPSHQSRKATLFEVIMKQGTGI